MAKDTQRREESAETFDREALTEDARRLVAAVEEIHPDPYIGYDGRVDLHSRLEQVVRNLPETATAEEFYRRAAPLVAGMEDAHSVLRPPDYRDTSDKPESDRRLPVSFRVVGNRLYVDSVFDDTLVDLLGAHLLVIGDESIEMLLNRVAALRGVENQYMALVFVKRMIQKHDSLARLLERAAPPEEPTIRVRINGEEQSIALTPVAGDRELTRGLDETFPHPTGTGPRYRLYEGGEAAVFVPGDLSGYRESFEVAMDLGAARGADLAPAAYDRHVGGDQPADLAETVAALPSMVETLADLIDDMAASDTETLIVDLRDNTGGDSQFVFHIAYALYGWDGVARTMDSIRALKRRTELHRERYGTGSEDSTADESLVDYDFSDFLNGRDSEEEESEPQNREYLMRSGTFAEFVESRNHEPVYQPDQIIVAISASTLSSAFAGAAQLTSLGAEIVGVPSGQAPLSFGEAVEKTLPNTELTASIAGSMYHWVPDPDTNVLPPDQELTPALFERYDRAEDAVLRLAFDYAGVPDSNDSPPKPVEQYAR